MKEYIIPFAVAFLAFGFAFLAARIQRKLDVVSKLALDPESLGAYFDLARLSREAGDIPGAARALEGHVGEVLHLGFSPDGRRLASAGVAPRSTIGPSPAAPAGVSSTSGPARASTTSSTRRTSSS